MQPREFIGLLGGDVASPFALAARKWGAFCTVLQLSHGQQH
jgi:hypothetical protein